MEAVKIIFMGIGSFLSVLAFSFTVFQYWRKKQEEKFSELKNETRNSITRMGERVTSLEQSVVRNFENRLSVIEGELRGIKPILQSIQNWFITNTPGKQ